MIGRKIFSIVAVPLNISGIPKSLLARIWEFQFNFFYYVGFVHYKPVYERESGCYILKKGHTLARLLSIVIIWIPLLILHAGVMTITIKEFHRTYNRSPSTYFGVLNTFLVYIQNGLFLFIILRRKDLFQKLINHSNSSCSFVHSCAGKEKRCNSKNLVLLYLVLAFVLRYIFAFSVVFALDYSELSKLVTPSDIYLKTLYNYDGQFILQSETNFADGPIRYINTIFFFSIWCIGVLINVGVNILIVGTIPITIWLTTREFTRMLESHDENVKNGTASEKMVDEICCAYGQLKEYSNSLNEMWSILHLVYLTEMSLGMSFTLKEMLETESLFTAVYYIFLACLEATALFLSGDVFLRIENFKCWLTEEKIREHFQSDHEKEKLQWMLRELDDRPIGIGNHGVYQLTYGFTAQMLIMMITFFLISFEK